MSYCSSSKIVKFQGTMDDKEPQKFTLSKRLKSFRYAWAGVMTFIRTEHNARLHLLAALAVVVSGLYFEISRIEWIIIVLCVGLVFTAEAFNTAIEYLCNVVHPEFNLTIKKVKDIAAGAVLIAAISSAVVGGLIFIPYLMRAMS